MAGGEAQPVASAPPAGPARIEDRLARRGGAVELLRAPAALFGVLARLRGVLYDRRWLPVLDVATPVVSVGNLAVGGTGKTPFVAWLCGRFAARGLSPGILSRGYRAAAQGGGPNDEARLLAALLPDVPHVQDRDRVRGAVELEARAVDVIVLDDGFQHRRLARDLDVVLVDALRPFGLPAESPASEPVAALLPRGFLREPKGALGRAHAVVVTRADAVPPAALADLERELARLAPRAALARAVHRPVGLRAGSANLSLAHLIGRSVDLVSGIGNPAAFERTALALGAVVAGHRRFPDHHPFTAADLAGLGARPVLTTAKDAVRLPAGLPFEPLVLDVALEVTEGAAALEALLDGLPESPARRARAALHEGLHG